MVNDSICPVDNSVSDQVLGWIITIGTAASFIPQMHSLVARKSTDGLSGVSWTMNYISNFGTALNVFLLRWHITMCCSQLDAHDCVSNLLPVLQLVVPCICVYIIYLLLAKYCVSTRPSNEDVPLLDNQRSRIDRLVDLLFVNNAFVIPLLVVSTIVTALSVGISVLLIYLYGDQSKIVTSFAQAWGIIALVLLVIQYIPQIYTTHVKKEAGSLSVATLLVQAPGALAVVYFQAIMNHGDWTTWSPYLCTAIQQSILIVQCVVYYCQKRQKATTQQEPKIIN